MKREGGHVQTVEVLSAFIKVVAVIVERN